MANKFWQKVDEIFPQVADLPDDAEREARLKNLCGDDENLRREISEMLRVEEKAENFIESPVVLPDSLSRFFSDAETERQFKIRLEGEKIGAYKILQKIGAGGMGTVYLAERADGEFQKKVAVKFIKKGADTDFNLSRFRRERQILANLEHPFIARLLDGGTMPDKLPYLVMEYVEGKNLLEFLRERNANPNESLRIFRQILAAVGYAHSKGLIHRDLKPGNILVNQDGVPKLLDFGIAKILDTDFIEEKASQTATFLRQLTPEYASPEQIKGEPITPASDIYSLGIILYEILTGRKVYKFPSHSPHEIARVICEEKISLPDFKFEISNADDLRFIVLKTLRKNPAERYASIDEFDTDIERFLEGLPILTESERLKFFENSFGESASANVSLAVAPFRILQTETEENSITGNSGNFLSVGLADALTTRLSGIRQIGVRPTSSVLRLSAEGKNAAMLGKILDVNYVLEGSLSRIGEQIRVVVQLLKTNDESVLWAQQFDESERDVFQLQDAICERVAASLVPHLTKEEQNFLRHHGTESAAAYEAYLRGRVSNHTYTFTGIIASEKHFKKAIAHDPDFALAHTGLADFYNWQAVAGIVSNREGYTAAKKSAQRAIEIAPNSSEAYASLAFAIWAFDWNFEEAERLFLKSIRLNPNNVKAHEWYSYLLSSTARHDEAIGEMNRAEQLDPYSPSVKTMFGFCFYNARKYEKGLEKTRQALEIEPDYYLPLQGLGWVCPPLGLFDEAIKGCRRAVEISDEMSFNKFSLAMALIAAGETEEARRIAHEIEERKQNSIIPAYFSALIYALLGEEKTAFEWLDEAIEERGYWTLWMNVEPRFDALRDDERFKQRLEKIKPLEIETTTGNIISTQTNEIKNEQNFPTKLLAFSAAGLIILTFIGFAIFQYVQKSAQNNSPKEFVKADLEIENSALSNDATANDFYRSGRLLLATRKSDDVKKAVDFFNEAVKRDANFALAFSSLADAYIVLATTSENPKNEYRTAEELATKSLALDPDLAEARVSLGMAKFRNTGDFAAAEKHFLRAIEIKPKSATARHWYGIILSSVGKNDDALRELKIAAQLDPESAIIQYALGSQLLEIDRLDEALSAYDKAIENNGAFINAYVAKSLIQQYRGDYDAALETYRTARIYNGADENEPLWLIMQAQTFASHGKKTEAENFLNRYFETDDHKKNPLAHTLDVALVYNLLNDTENTFAWLEKTEKTPQADFMKKDLRFENLRENTLFSSLLKNK